MKQLYLLLNWFKFCQVKQGTNIRLQNMKKTANKSKLHCKLEIVSIVFLELYSKFC